MNTECVCVCDEGISVCACVCVWSSGRVTTWTDETRVMRAQDNDLPPLVLITHSSSLVSRLICAAPHLEAGTLSLWRTRLTTISLLVLLHHHYTHILHPRPDGDKWDGQHTTKD